MIPQIATPDSEVSRRFPPLQPVCAGRPFPDPKPRRIVLWDEVGGPLPALTTQPYLEPDVLTVTPGPEKLAAPYGLRASLPSPLHLP